MNESIDLVILTRDDSEIRSEVLDGIHQQRGVNIVVHRVIGTPDPGDASRWQTIARARNNGKTQGKTPWIMFLDDDVVLAPDCVATLLAELKERPAYGAVASNYLEEPVDGSEPPHVGMGATLFRRGALRRIEFRWTDKLCECQCCCDDLRRQCIGITYIRDARSVHLNSDGPKLNGPHSKDSAAADSSPGAERPNATEIHRSAGADDATSNVSLGDMPGASEVSCPSDSSRPDGHQQSEPPQISETDRPGRILTAFDQFDFHVFRDQFLRSLRLSGNDESVTVVGYGLTREQERWLSGATNVDYLPLPATGRFPGRTRMKDFQRVLRRLPANRPVAYWDAGDCIFQGSLEPLWKLVRENRRRVLCCAEGANHPEDASIVRWTSTIRDAAAREFVFRLLSTNTYLNSGFAACTAGVMLRLFRNTHRIRNSSLLDGTTNPGDQTAFNYYCHTNPNRWREISCGWNYCLCHRTSQDVFINKEGFFKSSDGTTIHVVHGNANSFRRMKGFERTRKRIESYGSENPNDCRARSVEIGKSLDETSLRRTAASGIRQTAVPGETRKIFGIGLSKTGTKSLHAALLTLGYSAIHYVASRQWLRGDFRRDILSEFDAATDSPVPAYFEELDRRYPGSKFIYTTRPDLDDWLDSCQRQFARMNDGTVNGIRLAQYGVSEFSRDRFANVYHRHDARVREYFRDRPGDLLEFDLFSGEGWEKLATFLGQPVPSGRFPSIRRNLGDLTKVTRSRLESNTGRILSRLRELSDKETVAAR